MITEEQLSTVRGATVYDSDGDKVGKAGEVYLDDATGRPEWLTVNTGLFGSHESFVPLEQATLSGSDVRVPFDKAKIKDAPRVAADGHLEPAEEEELYRYYGVGSGQGSMTEGTAGGVAGGAAGGVAGGAAGGAAGLTGGVDRDREASGLTGQTGGVDRDREASGLTGQTGQTGQTGGVDRDDAATSGRHAAGGLGDDTNAHGTRGRDTSGPTTDEAMTLSQEELRVGTQTRESGRARLRKYVVTEEQTVTVPVSHEEVRVEREPITEANRGAALDGPAISEEEHEVTLHEEVPVVSKEARPVERVRAATETVTGQEQVSDEVRKEQVELDQGGETDTRRG
jgi:uncharacterized protein (TIGR02271 family)